MKIERYIIVKDNQWVVRSHLYGYRYVSLFDPDVLDKAFIFKTVGSAKRSLCGNDCYDDPTHKIVKISGDLTLDDKIDK